MQSRRRDPTGTGNGAGWTDAQPPVQSTWPEDPAAGPFSSQSMWPDCVPGASNTECFDQSPSYYETLQAADIDGTPGDELLGRLDDGLHVKSFGREPPTDGQGPYLYDDAGNPEQVTYFSEWTHATNVPGAIGGTESSASEDGLAIFTPGDHPFNVYRVIGPKGPNLGTFTLNNTTVVTSTPRAGSNSRCCTPA